jgi:hypothetical protein
MAIRDLIGKRGESIMVARLMDSCGRPEPYFDPHPLGEKCPTYDYLVELVNAGARVPYFLVQVKATRKALTRRQRRLSVRVSADDVRRMAQCPVPTYLIGVDELGENAYVVSIHGGLAGPITSMPSTYPLNRDNLKTLWDEVKNYWQALYPVAKTSVFTF